MILKLAKGLKGRAHTAWQSGTVLGGLQKGVKFALWAKQDPAQRWACRSGHFNFLMRWGDWPAVQEVLIEHEYQIINECLKGLAHPVVLDLGANIGTFSLYIFQNFPKAQVIAYEASATTFAVLNATHQLNGGLNWKAHQAAVWSEDGTVSFNSTEYSPSSRVAVTGKETVPAVALASIMASIGTRVDLAKVDIEGAEEAALAGREAELALIDNLIVELHPGRCDTDKVTATLRQVYPYIYYIPGRKSSKPLLLCAKREFSLPLFG